MKVTCVRRKSKKLWRFTPIECKHKDCTAAAVARRIQGPVTPDIQNMVESLTNMYDKYITEHMTQRQNAILQQLGLSDEGKEYYGYWQTAPLLLPQDETQEADAGDGQGGRKTDRA